MSATKPLNDLIPFEYQILESDTGTGRMIVDGVFQRAGQRNKNRRVYPLKVWEKVFGDPDFTENIEQRGMYGALDHPSHGNISLKEASHIVTALEPPNAQGEIRGRCEILNTPDGLTLQEIFRAKGRVGISSRADGSSRVETIDGERTEVIEDLDLRTFDFVANPSTHGAYPKQVFESEEDSAPEGVEPMETEQEFTALREDVNRVLGRRLEHLSADDRRTSLLESDDLLLRLGRITTKDEAYRPLTDELTKKLVTRKAALESSAAPPTPEKYIEAAHQVITEMLRQVKARAVLSAQAAAQKVASLKTENETNKTALEEYKNLYQAAREVGEDLYEQLQAASIKTAVDEELLKAESAPIRHFRDKILEGCKTVEDVALHAESLRKLAGTSRTRATRKGLPEAGAHGKPANPLRETQVPEYDEMEEMTDFLCERIGGRY